MKIALSLFALAALTAPLQAAPRLVGEVYPAGPTGKSQVALGGAFFPGQGWRDDAQSKGALIPGVRWQLFGLNGAGPSVTSDKGQIDDVPQSYYAQLRQNVTGDKPLIAISNASPNAQPRLPRAQNLNQESYQRAVAALLRARGLSVARAKLTQLLRVDLNGDGTDEVLMVATSRPDYGHTAQEKRGDYAIMALRYVDNGVVKTQVLDASISKKDVTFSAPGYFEVMSCVDVDGDGKMEIVGANGYYEGNGFEVWKFDGHSAKSVIRLGRLARIADKGFDLSRVKIWRRKFVTPLNYPTSDSCDPKSVICHPKCIKPPMRLSHVMLGLGYFF